MLKIIGFCLLTAFSLNAFATSTVTRASSAITGAALETAVAHLVQEEARFHEQAKSLRQRTEARQLALAHGHCHPDGPQTCVPHCLHRWSDSRCDNYGPDYCDYNATCAMNCLQRWSDGSCNSYGPDYCGNDVTCTPNCTHRSSNGECDMYGADTCY